MTGESLKMRDIFDLKKLITVFAVIPFLVAVFLFIIDKPLLAASAVLIIPAVLFLSNTRWALFLFLFCLYITIRIFESPSILIIDVAAIVLFGAFAINLLTKGKTEFYMPKIIWNYLLLMVIMIISLLFSFFPEYGITTILRIFIQISVVFVIFNIITKNDISKILEFYFWIAFIHSAINIAQFIIHSGELRVFGFASVYYDDLTILAIPLGFSYFLWSKSRQKAIIYLVGVFVLFFGLIATQSRGPLLTIGWVLILQSIILYYLAKKQKSYYLIRRFKLLIIVVLATVIFLVLSSGIFATVGGRFEELLDPSHGTIWLRISLWKTSVQAFMENPLLGIGPGNFFDAKAIIPDIKFDPARLYLSNESAHNLVLHYLAETGILGVVALILIFFKQFRTALQNLKSEKNSAISTALVGSSMILFGTIFYLDGWMWGQNAYVAPLFIAMIYKMAGDNEK